MSLVAENIPGNVKPACSQSFTKLAFIKKLEGALLLIALLSAPHPAVKHRKIRSLLTRPLGLLGWEKLEPVLLAALTTREPLLLIGRHGTAKSFLLEFCFILKFFRDLPLRAASRSRGSSGCGGCPHCKAASGSCQ